MSNLCLDGRLPVGQVSNRNGGQQIKNGERFSFMRGQMPTAVDCELAA